MSLLGALGKIGKGILKAAPVAASFIPGVGPAISGASKIAKLGAIGKAASPVLGGMAASQASGKRADAQDALQRDRLALDAYRMRLTAPETLRTGATRASMTANASPVKMTRDASGKRTISGGYANPGLINPDARQLADHLTHQYLLQGLEKDMGMPGMTPAPHSSVGDKIIGGAATATSLMGALPPRLPKKPGPATPPYVEPQEDLS